MSVATRKLCLLHVVANALLLWLGYEWLGVAESTRLRLVLSVVDALAILALACWLHGATLVYFHGGEPDAFAGRPTLNQAFRTALRNLGPMLAAALLVLMVYGLLEWGANALGQPAFRLASWLTLHLHKPVKPATVARIFQGVLWIVRWVILPVTLLPIGAGIAAHGWRGVGGSTWRGDWRYWPAVPALLLAGLQLPLVLLRWIPHFDAFPMQFASFVLRLLAAYLLFVAATVTLAFVTSRGRPVLSQPKTVFAP